MKAIRLHIKQNSANYKKEETVQNRMTFPLPPYSTVIGALHKACGYTSYHPMQVSVQGKYGSLKTKMYKDDCFLNRVEDDRNILVKMKNPDMLSSAYQIVATAQNTQGNSFEKGITINVINEKLLEEYRFLKRTKRRIDKHKKIINKMKTRLKEMKADENISAEEVKEFDKRIKHIKAVYDEYEKVKYTIPYSHFRTLAKGPKYYELLCDIEFIIHIVADENTMNDIMDNIGNLTAIGRGEDFVEVLECAQTELFDVENIETIKYDFYNAYIPIKYLERNSRNLKIFTNKAGGYVGGTKYLLPKNYTIENLNKGLRKRSFNKIPTIYGSVKFLRRGCKGVLIDKTENETYPVFLA